MIANILFFGLIIAIALAPSYFIFIGLLSKLRKNNNNNAKTISWLVAIATFFLIAFAIFYLIIVNINITR